MHLLKNNNRKYWLKIMCKIIDPVLNLLLKEELKENITNINLERHPYAPIEAFARVSLGITPYLNLELSNRNEIIMQKKYRELFYNSLNNAFNPISKDYVFGLYSINQPVVDLAFIINSLLRAPLLTKSIDENTKNNILRELEICKKYKPGMNNWLMFSAMIETGIYMLSNDGGADFDRIDMLIEKMLSCYKGDSIYGDGLDLHCDYYNSFVIHPMLVDLVSYHKERYNNVYDKIINRSRRYTVILERMISPEGYYPIVGRSITYRFGVFHLLAQSVLCGFLDKSIHPAQLRCALTKVIKNTISAKKHLIKMVFYGRVYMVINLR